MDEADRSTGADDSDTAGGAPDQAVLSETFEALGHETRLAIVEVLADERRVEWQPRGLRFSELRRAVGVSDAGKFNYHLNKLDGTFVYRDDDEYVLTNAGLHVAGAIRAGRFSDPGEPREDTVDRECPIDGSALTVSYQHGDVAVECPEHGRIYGTNLPPAAVRDRSMATVLDLAVVDSRSDIERALHGSCPHCWGHVDVRLPADDLSGVLDTRDASEADIGPTIVRFGCRECGLDFWLPASVCVVTHPAVVSYYRDHGVDARSAGYFGLDHITGGNGEVVAETPPRTEVVVATAAADRGLVLTLDGSAQVIDVDEVGDPTLPRPDPGGDD
jgi:DNA-binding transcriptional ArsR family regulator